MGLDNPDTLYFGTRVQPGHEYVVTGSRGTTADLSFQMLSGNYTADNVPGSETAFDDREARHRRRRHLRVAGHARTARRSCWSARSTATGRRSAAHRDRAHRHRRHRPAAADPGAHRKALRRRGKNWSSG